MIICHLKQIGKVKKLDISVPHDLTENKKNLSFWSIVFSYSIRSNEPFLNWIVRYMWRKLDFIQLAMSSSMLDLGAAPKHFPKPNLHQKRSWSLLDGLLLVWSTPTFWIPVKPLHLRSMLSKSMRCTENWNACSLHQSTKRAQFFSMTMPDGTSHNQCFESRMSRAAKFCLTCHIHLTSCQPTTTSSSISTTFLQRKCFHNQQEAENAF